MKDFFAALAGSRTVWFNIPFIMLLLIEVVFQNLVLLQPLFPLHVWPWFVAILTIGNLWLRALTDSPLFKKQE